MAVNRFNTPAEQNLMQTYVPLPFQEMAAAAQMIQQRHDTAEALADSLDDDLLGIKAYRELDKRYLTDYRQNLDNELSGLIKKHNGRYADMLPDLKLIQKRVNRDLTAGNLAAIKMSGEQLALYDQGVLDTKKDEKYDPYLDSMLGAGYDRAVWMSEGMKNIGTELQPNYIIDEDYYQNNVTGQPLSSYKYTGVWQASDMLSQLDKVYGKVKKDSQEVTYNVTDPDGTVRTITEKIDQITPAKIAEAALNNISALSPNARQELALWSASQTDDAVLAYADAFLQTLLSDEMMAAETQDQIDDVNERYSSMWAEMTDEDGNPTAQAIKYAELWNINEEGRKYITGDTTLKDVADTKNKYKSSTGGSTHTYRIIDTGTGPELQITPVVNEFGEDIIENSNDALLTTWNKSVNQNYTNYVDAVEEYNKWREQTPGDVDHLADLERIVNSARYTYEASAFLKQQITQQAAIDANYKYVGHGAGMNEKNEAGYYYEDITFGPNNELLSTFIDVGYGDTGDNIPMRYNIDVMFDDQGKPISPDDVNAIWAHIRNRTLTDEDGFITGFTPGLHENPLMVVDEETGVGVIDPRTADYTGRHSIVYDASYVGNTPLDKAKVKLYEKRKKELFGGRTREITELAGTGNKRVDEQIRTAITENWLNEDFMFMGQMTNQTFSMLEDPGTDAEALKDIIADINGDGNENQEDVMEFLEQVKKGDVRILWESVPNSTINDGAGGYRGVVKVPTKTGAQTLYFTAPQAYLNEIMTYHVDMDGNYVKMSPNESQMKWMNYNAQIDLDRAMRLPGNIVPTATLDENNNPIGWYYFGINPNDGTPLRSDEYIFVPNKNVITAVDVVEGQIVETRATGEPSGAIDVDDNTRDLARILMLNDPNQAATKKFWYNQLDVTPATEPIKREFDKTPIINNNDNTIIDNNINIDNEDKDNIIVVDPNDKKDKNDNDYILPEEIDPIPEGFDENGNRIPEEIIKLPRKEINKEEFRQKTQQTRDDLDKLIIRNEEAIIDPDDYFVYTPEDDQILNFLTNDPTIESTTNPGEIDKEQSFVQSSGPGALVITQPGDEIFPEGAMMSNDYRIWNLTTGQQLDQNGNVIGPREYDHYYYQNDDGFTVHVDFTLSDNIDADGQPIESPNEYDIDLEGEIIENEGNDPIINPNDTDIIDDEDNDPLPGGNAPNTIVTSPQTYNTEITLRNGTVIKGEFNVDPGQLWFDDSQNTYHTWAMHRGPGIKPEQMQVKKPLLDALLEAETNINKDMFDIFAGLYGDLGGGALSEDATKHGAAKILGWIDESGNTYPYKGFQWSPDDDTYYGELPEGFTQDDLKLQWSDNYNETYHNRDGSVKDEYLGDRKQILNGNFPGLELISAEEMTVADGTTASIADLIKQGKIAIMTKTGVMDPFMRNNTRQSDGNIFNIPMADVWRSYESQKRAYDKYQKEGGSPVAPPGHSFHEAGQAFDISQSDNDYGIYIVDLSSQGELNNIAFGSNKWKMETLFSTTKALPAIQLDDIIYNGTRPWNGMDNEIQKLVTQRLIDMNKKDGYTLAQLSASNPKNNEWWHFSIGEMTTYREPLMPGNKYGTYKYVR
mgnify:CR=1 FL=1|tara:strand:+ start:3895 stop:8652 length:4758 start_codon:yes stop_codon:yes gene_type:complete